MQLPKDAPLDTYLKAALDLQNQERWQESIDVIEQCLRVHGGHPLAFYVAGRAYEKQNNLQAAAQLFEATLKHDRGFVCLLDLGKVYLRLRDPARATPLLVEALSKKPQSAEALSVLGQAYLDSDDNEQAEKALTAAAKIEETPENQFNLGLAYLRTGRPENALQAFTRSVELNEADPEAWEYLGQTYCLLEQYVHGILILHKLAKENPASQRYRHLLTNAFKEFKPETYEPVFREALLCCLDMEGLSYDYLNLAFTNLMARDPAQDMLRAALDAPSYEAFAALAAEIPTDSLNDELLCRGLTAFLTRDMQFEAALTHLRRFALETNAAGKRPELLPFMAAMAAQCFLNEYVFDETPVEAALVANLQAKLTKNDEWTDDTAITMLLLAAYRPLAPLIDTLPLLTPASIANAPKALTGVLFEQITDWLAEREIRKTIPSLQASGNEVSAKVRAMYEENPYPRWKHVYRDHGGPSGLIDIDTLRRNAGGQRLEMLNAGCGTGQHVMISSAGFPDANITAVDLSLASLAYAKKRCTEAGVTNVTFYQGDILELGNSLPRQFDIIESAGVLHHMEDPMRGWQVLTNLLKPGGLMRIGLYSETARQNVVASRQFIADNGFEPTLEGIHACRAALKSLSDFHPAKSITGSPDFYSTSLCRDLIFHVQEHRFTIPQLKDCLAKLGLEFMSFSIASSKIITEYIRAYPDDKKMTSLDNWHEFEQRNPHTFANMYQFWCRKPHQTIH